MVLCAIGANCLKNKEREMCTILERTDVCSFVINGVTLDIYLPRRTLLNQSKLVNTIAYMRLK